MSLSIKEQYDKIYKYCYFKTGSASLAEVLTQETFLKYFAQSSYIDRGKALAYLYTIAKNLCIDSYRNKPADELKEDYPAPDKVHNVELRVAVRQALDTLIPEDQELLLLRFVNELSMNELCKITGLSRFSLYRRMVAALGQLKSVLRKEDFYE